MTKFYDALVAFAKKNSKHPDNHADWGWDQNCALLMSRIGNAPKAKGGLGWKVAPSAYGDAIDVAHASGKLNGTASAAPVGAYHFWDIGRYGHVGIDASGKGKHIFMATSHLEDAVVPHLGFSSAAAYTRYAKLQGGRYLGWSTNYHGGKVNIPAEPKPKPKPKPTATQRQVHETDANVRNAPKPTGKLTAVARANTIHDVKGYVHGQKVTEGKVSTDVWYVLESGYSWAGAYTSHEIGKLKDLTKPAPITVRPPVITKPPVVTPPVVKPIPPVVKPPVITTPIPGPIQPTETPDGIPIKEPSWVAKLIKLLSAFFGTKS